MNDRLNFWIKVLRRIFLTIEIKLLVDKRTDTMTKLGHLKKHKLIGYIRYLFIAKKYDTFEGTSELLFKNFFFLIKKRNVYKKINKQLKTFFVSTIRINLLTKSSSVGKKGDKPFYFYKHTKKIKLSDFYTTIVEKNEGFYSFFKFLIFYKSLFLDGFSFKKWYDKGQFFSSSSEKYTLNIQYWFHFNLLIIFWTLKNTIIYEYNYKKKEEFFFFKRYKCNKKKNYKFSTNFFFLY